LAPRLAPGRMAWPSLGILRGSRPAKPSSSAQTSNSALDATTGPIVLGVVVDVPREPIDWAMPACARPGPARLFKGGGNPKGCPGAASSHGVRRRFIAVPHRFFTIPDAGRLNARREASVRAQRLAQRGHQVPLDHVEEDAGDGVLPVEELLEQVARHGEKERPLARDRGDRRWPTVDEALVAERLPRPRQPDSDAPVAANEHLLDCTIDRPLGGSSETPQTAE
jgi:hypothetical protein